MQTLATRIEALFNQTVGTELEPAVTPIFAISLIQAGDYARARDLLEQANLDVNQDPEVLNYLAGCYIQLKDYSTAKDKLLQALAIEPESPELTVYLGSVLYELGEVNQAIAKYKSVIARFGDFVFAYECLADVLFQVQNYEESLAVAELGLTKSDYKNAMLWFIKGNILALQEDKQEEATAALASAISCDEKFYSAWFQLAVLLNMLNREDEANLALSRIPTDILEQLVTEAKSKLEEENATRS